MVFRTLQKYSCRLPPPSHHFFSIHICQGDSYHLTINSINLPKIFAFSNTHIRMRWAGTGGNETFAMEILKISAGRKKQTIMERFNYLNTNKYFECD